MHQNKKQLLKTNLYFGLISDERGEARGVACVSKVTTQRGKRTFKGNKNSHQLKVNDHKRKEKQPSQEAIWRERVTKWQPSEAKRLQRDKKQQQTAIDATEQPSKQNDLREAQNNHKETKTTTKWPKQPQRDTKQPQSEQNFQKRHKAAT